MNQVKYDFGPQVRGDSINERTVTVNIDSAPADITSASMNVRDTQDKLIYNVTLGIAGNVITIPEIPGSETSSWPITDLRYDIETILASGKVRTYIQGIIPIKKDYTYV